eukprot:56088-Pyramimonas_sp.AAC.1
MLNLEIQRAGCPQAVLGVTGRDGAPGDEEVFWAAAAAGRRGGRGPAVPHWARALADGDAGSGARR